MAVIGLGSGSSACYAQPGAAWTFFEIDPVVEHIAASPRFFTFLRDSPGRVSVVLGDGRLSLQASADRYDLLVLDAFSSDAIPVHLATAQAFALYLSRLRPSGMVLFNISNRYLDLEPVVAALAQASRVRALVRYDVRLRKFEEDAGKTPSIWVVMARRGQDLDALARDPRWHPLRADPRVPLWTDDFSNIFGVLRRPNASLLPTP